MAHGATATHEDRAARLALSQLVEPGDPVLAEEVRVHGPVAALHEWTRKKAPATSETPAIALARADELLRRCGPSLRWVCPDDAEWPHQVDDLDHVEAVQRRGGPPLGLWVSGLPRLDDVATRLVAIVGSRTATTYGTEMAGDLAAECAKRGIGVVSGAAYGIDAAAHRGALAAEGMTAAVLACGVDVAYPRGHESLLRRIGEDGVVVSELPLGTGVTRLRFLSRNRLIAALTAGTVVVEAAARSGSLNTANWAGRLGRAVMGVPGPVTSSASFGVHRLIRDGGAELVTCGAEIAESISALGSETCAWVEGERRLVDDLEGADRQVLEALDVRVARSVIELAVAARASAETTETALGRLLLTSLAERTAQGWRLSADAVGKLRAT